MSSYTIEHKVLHQEWDEIVFSAQELIASREKFCNHEVHFLGNPTFKFENGTVYADETWNVTQNRVSTNSYQFGLVDWDKESGQYVLSFHYRLKELGQLVSASFKINTEIKKIFGL